MLGFPGLLGQHGDQHLGQFYKQICEGELHDHSGEGEDGVGVGDLPGDIAGRKPFDQDEKLREIYAGKWEGITFESLKKNFPESALSCGSLPSCLRR